MIAANLTKMLVRSLAATLAFVALLAISPAFAQTDPSPSWNDGPTKDAIVGFVEKVTDKEGKDYVPPEDRIATFDNVGKLWIEQPMYMQLAFVLDRMKALAPEHPEWKDQQFRRRLSDAGLDHVGGGAALRSHRSPYRRGAVIRL